jgi:hypothetical protein
MRNIEQLGQVFTPPTVVNFMLDLCRNKGRALEPSAGDGAFFQLLQERQPIASALKSTPRLPRPALKYVISSITRSASSSTPSSAIRPTCAFRMLRSTRKIG